MVLPLLDRIHKAEGVFRDFGVLIGDIIPKLPILWYSIRRSSGCGEMASEGGKSFARRDLLLKIRSEVQRRWEEGDVFRADAKEKPPEPGDKFFGNFPYSYMNGSLHLGHAFSLSNLEFSSAYHRLRGSERASTICFPLHWNAYQGFS